MEATKEFCVYHCATGNGYTKVISRHATPEEALEECVRLNEEEREANGGRSDSGHHYECDQPTELE